MKHSKLGSGRRSGSRWWILGRYRIGDAEGVRGLAQASNAPSSRESRECVIGIEIQEPLNADAARMLINNSPYAGYFPSAQDALPLALAMSSSITIQVSA